MCPYYQDGYDASTFFVESKGNLSASFVWREYPTRPVISLKFCVILSGDGSTDNPYTVSISDSCASEDEYDIEDGES